MKKINFISLFGLLLACFPALAQNTASHSGNWNDCATWGNPSTIFNFVTDTKTINTGVNVVQNTAWGAKIIDFGTGNGSISFATSANSIAFVTDAGDNKTCAPAMDDDTCAELTPAGGWVWNSQMENVDCRMYFDGDDFRIGGIAYKDFTTSIGSVYTVEIFAGLGGMYGYTSSFKAEILSSTSVVLATKLGIQADVVFTFTATTGTTRIKLSDTSTASYISDVSTSRVYIH